MPEYKKSFPYVDVFLYAVFGKLSGFSPVVLEQYLVSANAETSPVGEVAALRNYIESGKFPATKTPMLLRLDSCVDYVPDKAPPPSEGGFVVTAQIGDIVAGYGSFSALVALCRDERVRAIESSRAGLPQESSPSVAAIRADPPIIAPGGASDVGGETGAEALIGIIDTGVDVRHQVFREVEERLCILAVWDQTDIKPKEDGAEGEPNNSGAEGKPDNGIMPRYGVLHNRAEILKYQKAQKDGTQSATQLTLVEMEKFRRLGHDPRGHGTSVASFAAGRSVSVDYRGRQKVAFAGGVAPEAQLVVVKTGDPARPNIPSADPLDPASLGYSAQYVEALVFLRDFARAENNRPLVVNISYGMNGGAHDGTTLLEAAFDNLTEGGRLPGIAVVCAAGNESLRGHHARIRVRPGETSVLRWRVPDDYRESLVVEAWAASGDEIEFTLTPPASFANLTVNSQNSRANAVLSTGEKVNMWHSAYHHDNGDNRLLLTVVPATGKAVTPKEWQLTLRCGAVRSRGVVDAWIENLKREGGPHFLPTPDASERGTLTIPSTARTVITVGAVRVEPTTQGYGKGDLLPDSSHGPTRDKRRKPDLCAPGVDIMGAAGSTDSGLEAADYLVTSQSGSSFAAPHVAGAVALLFSHRERQIRERGQRVPACPRLNAAQVAAALRDMAQGDGLWREGEGYGLLDVRALLAAFRE